MDVVQDILIHQTQMMRNSSLEPYSPPKFIPSPHIIAVNALFSASLGTTLLAAFIAMLIKTWIREFDRGLSRMSIPEQRAKTREFRKQGMLFWKLPEIVALLPFLIQTSLLLFSIGLVIFLFNVSPLSCWIMTTILGIGVLFYAITTFISIILTSSPFRSPLSRWLGTLYQRFHTSLYPTMEEFSSMEMDAAPRTYIRTCARRMQTFIQRSRPYPEEEFVKPIADALGDTTQLRISRAALEWLHNTVPSSEHSEDIHWSVWLTASTPAFLVLPSLQMPHWIDLRFDNPEYLARHSVGDLRALYIVSLRCNHSDYPRRRDLIQRLRASGDPWDKVLVEIDQLLYFFKQPFKFLNSELPTADTIVDMIKSNLIRQPELLLLLEMLSGSRLQPSSDLRWDDFINLRWNDCRSFIDICVAIMWMQGGLTPEPQDVQGAILVDTTVTFAALVLLPVEIRQAMLTQRRQYPWLLPSLRNQAYMVQMVAGARKTKDPSLIFSTNLFLFLVILYLIRRESFILAREYMVAIVRDDDLLSWTRVLAAATPIMITREIWAMTSFLIVERDHRSQVPPEHSPDRSPDFHKTVLQKYDVSLKEGEEPDPYLLVALLRYDPDRMSHQILSSWRPFTCRSPWMCLAVNAMFSFRAPVGANSLPDTSRNDKVLNIIAAKWLLNVMREKQIGEPVEMPAIFLLSREFIIASLSLKYAMDGMSRNTDESRIPEPPHHFNNAVQISFDPRLSGHQLLQGWSLLKSVISKWELLPPQWRRRFADAFFAFSRRELPRRRATTLNTDILDELEAMISWTYVHGTEEGGDSGWYTGMEWFLALQLYAARKDRPNYGPGSVESSSLLDALGELIAAATDEVLGPLFARIRKFAHGILLQDDRTSAAQKRLIAQIDKMVLDRVRASLRDDWSFCALYFD